MFEFNEFKPTKSEEIWSNKPSTIEGILDGFTNINEIDIENSVYFIETLKKRIGLNGKLFEYGLDAGCGIGRVTPMLMRYCKKLDLCEPVSKHLDIAIKNNPNTCEAINSNLQNFCPYNQRYDFIWIQWTVMFLSNKELIDLLIRIRKSLKEIRNGENECYKGIVCIKDNINFYEDEIDEDNNCITRTLINFHKIFAEAGYKCILEIQQNFLPSSIKPIITFAITPY